MAAPAADRFWEKVRVDAVVVPALGTPCWLWKAAVDKDGYGVFGLSTQVKSIRAHRFSWECVNGPIPEGLQVLHRCDNPPCVNPQHCWLGTHVENHADKARKNRAHRGEKRDPSIFLRGESHPSTYLSQVAVEDIRANYIPRKVTLEYFSKKYDTSVSNVHAIVKGKSRVSHGS